MASQTTLSIALLTALSSNILLLIILLLKSSNVPPSNKSPGTHEPTPLSASWRSGNGFIDSRATSNGVHVLADWRRITNDNLLLLRLFHSQLLRSASALQVREQDYLKSSDSDEERADVNMVASNWKYMKQPYRADDAQARDKDHPLRSIFGDRDLSATAQTWDKTQPIRASNVRVKPRNGDSVPEESIHYLSINDVPYHRPHRNLSHLEIPGRPQEILRRRLGMERDRREAVAPSSGESRPRTHEVFSSLTDSELARFDPAVYDVLIPALVHLETMIIREFDSMHSIVVAHDLRLEKLEQAMLNIKDNSPDLQADSTDNKSQPDTPSQILDSKDGLLSAGNNSNIVDLFVEEEGSGDSQLTLTQTMTSPSPGPVQNVAFYDMYRILGTLEQKVMSLENYNIMSDSELTRVRSEVVKMDDKVTELDRQQRNMQIRTSMHTQKVTELEVYMSKSELGIHTALDSYSRVNSRLETFKDKLNEFKSDLQAVAVQFSRHDQITNELRAADSYKAHDIQEVRKSVFSLEGRLSGLYQVLDHNLETVRTDVRAMLGRVCTNNKLVC